MPQAVPQDGGVRGLELQRAHPVVLPQGQRGLLGGVPPVQLAVGLARLQGEIKKKIVLISCFSMIQIAKINTHFNRRNK